MTAARKTHMRHRVLAGASAAALGWAVATAAMALPSNPTIFANSPIPGVAATFTPDGPLLTIQQNAERVVIDWDSFNISSFETVTFDQGGDNFIAFNRIDPSAFTTIDGNLTANGSVWIFSPGGMLFGANAQVNVGSFFAGLGQQDDFQANQAVNLSTTTFTALWNAAENPNALTVAPGAQITAGPGGFVGLQAAHLDMGGDVTGDQVGYMISDGGGVTIVASGQGGWSATNFDQTSFTGFRENPYFNHTGTTTAVWIELESAVNAEADFETIINLDGVMSASGINSTTGLGISVFGGVDSVAGTTNGSSTTVNLLGDISTVGKAIISGSDIVISGDISGVGDVQFFAYNSVTSTVASTVESTAGMVMLHAHGDEGLVAVYGDLTAATDIDLWTTSAGTQTTVDGFVAAGGQVRIRSGGDIVIGQDASITGDLNADSLATGLGVIIASGAALQTPANTYYLSSGDVLIEDGSTIIGGLGAPDQVQVIANGGDVDFYGLIDGSRVIIRGNGLMTIGGEINATDDLLVLDYTIPNPNTGDGIVVTSDAMLISDNRIALIGQNGSIEVQSGAVIQSDADGVPTLDLFGPATNDGISFIAADGILIESGVSIDGGEFNRVYFEADGVDYSGFVQAAIDVSSDINAGDIVMIANNGSIRIRDGATLEAGSTVFIDADRYFVLEDGASIIAGFDPLTPHNELEFPYVNFNQGVSVTLHAQDFALYGDVTSADAIILVADTQAGYAYLGGEDGGSNLDGYDLGAVTFITNDEFQNLDAPTIIVLAGADGNQTAFENNSDLTVRDLTVNGDVVDHLLLGTSSDNVIFITGDLSATGVNAPDLSIGFAAESNILPLLSLRSFVPGNIVITGSIGSLDNPFGQVTLIATGDIGMGTEEFLYAAVEDPEFNAAEQSSNYDVDEGHIWISAEGLSIASGGRVIQQNTGAQGEFAGLVIGAPSEGQEVIFVPDDLDGLMIGGAEPFTLSFNPTHVELFGVVHGENAPVEGRDVAQLDFLVDPDLEDSSDMFFNGCQFGGGPCGGADEVPHFDSPTDTGMDDLAEIDDDQIDDQASDEDEDQAASEDQDSELFRSLVTPGADRAYEQERIGEPITGSGNEDLWTGRGAGDKP